MYKDFIATFVNPEWAPTISKILTYFLWIVAVCVIGYMTWTMVVVPTLAQKGLQSLEGDPSKLKGYQVELKDEIEEVDELDDFFSDDEEDEVELSTPLTAQ